MLLADLFEYLPTLLSLLAFVVAARHVVRGTFAPEPVSRGMWMVISGIALLLLIQTSSESAAIPLGIGLFSGSVLLFVLSLRTAVFHWHKDDFVAIGGAVACLIVWFLTGSPFIALIAILGTDLLAFIPTYAKVWHTPLTEDRVFWSMLLIASSVSMFDLFVFRGFELSNLLYNSYFVITQASMLGFISFKRRQGAS